MDVENDGLNISQLGVYPPPYGGVSVHIQRLQALLSENGIQCIVYDFSRYPKNDKNIINIKKIKNWPRILNPKGRIVHLHKSDINLEMTLILSSLYNFIGKEVLITYHSLRDDIEHFNSLKKIIFKASDRFISHYIAVGPHIKNKLLSLNINAKKISIIPAFLPPIIKHEEINTIPKEIWDFIESHDPIISANAYRITFYHDQDLYGIDMCVDLCANLKNAYPKIGLVFCLSDIGDIYYFKKMKKKIEETGIANNFLFVTRPLQFYPILMKSNLFVRPTNTDGDAISIREALYVKIPTVASDIVFRPERVILFKNRNINDFTLKVKDVLNNYEKHKKLLEVVKMEDNFEKIIEIYNKLNGYSNKEL